MSFRYRSGEVKRGLQGLESMIASKLPDAKPRCRAMLVACGFGIAATLHFTAPVHAGDTLIRLADARSDAQTSCRQKLGPGAVAEEEFDFGETTYVCNCASPFAWNDDNTRCVQTKSGQATEPQTDISQSKEVGASTVPDADQQVQEPPQPTTKCDKLAAHPDDTSNATGVSVTFDELRRNPQPAIAACRFARSKDPGSPRIMYQLARALRSTENYSEAFGLYKTAAEAGHVVSMASLGVMYGNGLGTTRDPAEAVRWHRNAAGKGSATAMVNLGVVYLRGEGVSKDDVEAARWYRMAADKGNSTAMHNLSGMLRTGRGVAQDNKKSAALMFKALMKADKNSLALMTNTPEKTNKQFRRELQKLMKQEGVYDGAIDGAFGPATQRAIRKLAGRTAQ